MAVQIVHSSRRGARDIEHLGSAHDKEELEALKAVAKQWLAEGQGELDVGLDAVPGAASRSGPLRIVSLRMGHLWDGLCAAYDALGFAKAAGGDEVFRQLVLARIIEPITKLGLAAGAGRDRGRPGLLAIPQAPIAGLRQG